MLISGLKRLKSCLQMPNQKKDFRRFGKLDFISILSLGLQLNRRHIGNSTVAILYCNTARVKRLN